MSFAERFAPIAASLALALTGCGEDPRSLACPLLAPGALSLFGQGASLTPVASDAAETVGAVSNQVPAAALGAHAIWLRKGEEVKVRAVTKTFGAEVELIAYGPRDAFGGLPFCGGITSGQAPTLTLSADQDGEWVVLVGSLPGGEALEYSVRATCEAGCDAAAPRCPTLAERGCGATRCDGELGRDEAGCLTCACDGGALCGPDRAAGPGGSCVLPACDCSAATPAAVCGVDGQTWPSACAARCAGVPIAPGGEAGPCEVACPALAACESPCFGLRTLGADGCPTCECSSRFATDAASCAACPLDEAPVCGSDGVTYGNACRARCAGAKVLYAAACSDACRAAPAGCTLDCAFGLKPVAGGESCLACACADVPTSCDPSGAPVCATLPGPVGKTTVGSACVALALGASDGAWGPCGVACVDGACPEGSACREGGFLAGRCLVEGNGASLCGCSAVLEPVCGDDGTAYRTFDNRCLARCAGATVLHPGACCEAFSGCDEGRAQVDMRGCPTSCGDVRSPDCAPNAATAEACGADQEPLGTSACAAHFAGDFATPEACP